MDGDEGKQVQMIMNAALATANDLSLSGNHLSATNVTALIQLARVFWTRLQPPAPVQGAPTAPPEEPPEGRRHLESI